jgi:hypothetical protein
MADVLIQQHSSALSPHAVRWTREDCTKLEQVGALNYPYELVDGVINQLGQNIRHAGIVRRLIAWLFLVFGEEFVLTQTSIDVRPEENPTNAPQPDAIVLTCSDDSLIQNPTPADLRLVVEAADTTLAYDLSVKAGLYARAQIVEYWVIDLGERRLYVHRQPADGIYRDIMAFGENESVSSLAAPNAAVEVSKLLPIART